MARNSEKQYGRLNRLILFKEKEEYEKSHPKRPKLNSLDTVEEIQKWLPSIKQDMDFYLKKSEVICYSDEHIEECKQKVISLEKEFKAFVRKIHQLTPGTLNAIPWTNRPYKRKCSDSVEQQPLSMKQFKPISTPILDKETIPEDKTSFPVDCLPFMDQPLTFIPKQITENLEAASSSDTTIKSFVCKNLSSNNLKLTCSDKEAIPTLVSYTYSSDSDG